MKRLVLASVLVLTGCAQLGAALTPGPDPKVAAFNNAVKPIVERDKKAHPELAGQDDGVLKMGDEAVGSKSDLPPFIRDGGDVLSTINPIYGLAFTTLSTLALGWLTKKNTAKVESVGSVVNQHATLIDSVTPETADNAAKHA